MNDKEERFRCMGSGCEGIVLRIGDYCQDCTDRVLRMARHVREHPEEWPENKGKKDG